MLDWVRVRVRVPGEALDGGDQRGVDMGDMGIGTIRLEFLLGFRFVCLGSFGERLNER